MSKSSLPAQHLGLFEQTADGSTAAWKQEVNQRLAAHRNRRGNAQSAEDQAPAPKASSTRAAEAAARVAARYAQAPSYNEFMAGEARAVVRAAATAAEAAAYSAQVAAQAVLAGLEHPAFESGFENRAHHSSQDYWPAEPTAPARWQDEPPSTASDTRAASLPQSQPRGQAQARWQEALPPNRDDWSEMRVHPAPPDLAADYRHLDEQDPLAHAVVEPVQLIPANLIEFPREITAPRKARPRQDEGPVYDNSQLNIFEVDPDLLPAPLAIHRTAADSVAPPEWASIQLDHAQVPHTHPAQHAVQSHDGQPTSQPQVSYTEHTHAEDAPAARYEAIASPVAPVRPTPRVNAPPAPNPYNQAYAHAATLPSHAAAVPLHTQTASSRRTAPVAAPVQSLASEGASPRFAVELLVAPFSDRMLATVVDAALVTLAFLAAAVVAIASFNHMPSGRVALIASACGFALFSLLYQYLFLSYAEEGTPGMRYARIALCTFSDDNPTREQMRKRIPAMLLAAAPAGVGLLWSLLDKDHLGWHDHLTKTYQRKY